MVIYHILRLGRLGYTRVYVYRLLLRLRFVGFAWITAHVAFAYFTVHRYVAGCKLRLLPHYACLPFTVTLLFHTARYGLRLPYLICGSRLFYPVGWLRTHGLPFCFGCYARSRLPVHGLVTVYSDLAAFATHLVTVTHSYRLPFAPRTHAPRAFHTHAHWLRFTHTGCITHTHYTYRTLLRVHTFTGSCYRSPLVWLYACLLHLPVYF